LRSKQLFPTASAKLSNGFALQTGEMKRPGSPEGTAGQKSEQQTTGGKTTAAKL
jgi:hypothetical protein